MFRDRYTCPTLDAKEYSKNLVHFTARVRPTLELLDIYLWSEQISESMK